MNRTKFLTALIIVLALCLVFVACAESETYNVTFSGANVDEQTVTRGDKATRPAVDPHKNGYDFAGWYKDADFSEEFVFENEIIKRDTTVYAKFEAKTYIVTFHGAEIDPESVKYGETIKTADPEPPEGMVFAGWYTEAAKIRPFVKGTPVTKNLDLWAKFSEKELPAEEMVVATFFNPSDGESITVQVKKGEAVPESKLPYFFHKYIHFYSFSNWDNDVEQPLEQNTTFTALFEFMESTVIPDKYFNFILQDDGTYGIVSKTIPENVPDAKNYPTLTGARSLPSSYNGKPVSRILSEGVASKSKTLFDLEELLVPESYKIVCEYGFYYASINNIYFTAIERIEGGSPFFGLNWNKEYYEIHLPKTLECLSEEYGLQLSNTEVAVVKLDENNPYFHFEIDEFGNNLLYNTARDTIYFVQLNRSGKTSFTFPAHVTKLLPVLSGNQTPETLTIEGDRESIGELASARGQLRVVRFTGSVKRLEKRAFFAARNIIAFELPEGLEYIAPDALYAVNLAKLTINDSVWRLMTTCGLGGAFINGYEFSDDLTLLEFRNNAIIELGTGPEHNGKKGDTFILYLNDATADTYTVPDGVTAFKNVLGTVFTNENLRKIIVPDGVTELPSGFMATGEVKVVWTGTYSGHYEVEKAGVEYLSLPSTLKKLCSNAIASTTFKGFEWPNGSNLEVLERNCISLFDMREPLVLPDTLKEVSVKPFSEVYNATIEGTAGKYVTFDGFLFQKLNETDLRCVYIPLSRSQRELIFPDTGNFVIKEIGRKALTEMGWNEYDLGAFFSLLEKIVVPEGVEVIEDEAFAFMYNLKELTLPSTLKALKNGAFYYCNKLEKVTFLGEEPPEMKHVFYYLNEVYAENKSIYAIFQSDTRVTMSGLLFYYFGCPLDVEFVVPAESYEAYFWTFYDYWGETYARHLTAKGIPKNTYRFHTNGGNVIADVEYESVLWHMPLTVWKGEGAKHLEGYFTKDGSQGDWGERIDVFPYFGNPDADGVVHLYAKWAEEIFETGRDWNFAYEVTTEKRTLNVHMRNHVYFQFMPQEDGQYECYVSALLYKDGRDTTIESRVDPHVFTVDKELEKSTLFFVEFNGSRMWNDPFAPMLHPIYTSRLYGYSALDGTPSNNLRAGTTYYLILSFNDDNYDWMNKRRESTEITIRMERAGDFGGGIVVGAG